MTSLKTLLGNWPYIIDKELEYIHPMRIIEHMTTHLSF